MRNLAYTLLAILLSTSAAAAQVHYQPNGSPWNHKLDSGPDAKVPGWYYNLGITGLRVELVEEAPTILVVRHVLEDSPADGKVRVDDWIVGATGERFTTPHRNGYGMDKFGGHGPIASFAAALEQAQTKEGKGRLALMILRDGKSRDVELRLGRDYGAFSDTFPADCEKSTAIREQLLDYLLEEQGSDGSWGDAPANTFAPLALLASGKKSHLKAVERNVRWHAKTTSAEDKPGLVNWRYMSAAIVMSEYYLATGDKWVLKELEQVRDFLMSTQYLSLEQVNPRVKESHPQDWPTDPMEQHGGWGHNPGFEGYGPIAMITGQGALAFALMKHCGLEIDRERHDAAYAFLERASGDKGYVWYEDSVGGGAEDWADMGRTGAAGLANLLAPYRGSAYRKRGEQHAALIGAHPESFPDTHGSPLMGMGYAAAAASFDDDAFRSLMDSHRWWFALAQCPDGSYYYQPNRDNAGYGPRSRMLASAITAFILGLPDHSLHLSGKRFDK